MLAMNEEKNNEVGHIYKLACCNEGMETHLEELRTVTHSGMNKACFEVYSKNFQVV